MALAVAIGASVVIASVRRSAPGDVLGNTIAADRAAAAAGGPRAKEPGAGTSSVRVPDVAWLADRGDGVWVFGRGPSARVLPGGEFGLAIDDRYLATSTPATDGRSTIHIRATSTGALVRDVDASIWVSAAAWTPRGLVVTGYRDASMSADGGLILVSPTGSMEVLVPAGPFPAALGRPVARGDVVVSASRRIVASNVCGVSLCDRQVIDLASGTVFRPAKAAEGFLRAVTDDAVVTTDADARWISGRRFADGREVWRRTDTVLLDPVAAAGGSMVGVVGSKATGWGVDRIDGVRPDRHLTPRVGADAPWPRIWTQLSTPTVIVIGHASFGEALGSSGGADIDVLDLDAADRAPLAARFVLSLGGEASR